MTLAPHPHVPERPRLVDVVDRLFDRGIVIRGELWLSVADIDLVFIGADVLVASADRMHAGRRARPEPAP